MKYIVAVIQPDRLNEVMDALEEKGIHMVTVTQVMGHGRQKGQAEVYRGHKEVGRLLKKVKLDIALNEEFVEPAIEAICGSAKTDHIGDGKIFVMNMDECIRIRTGEKGSVAIG